MEKTAELLKAFKRFEAWQARTEVCVTRLYMSLKPIALRYNAYRRTILVINQHNAQIIVLQ